MKDIPEKIYLQIEEPDAESFKEFETTWCVDKINDGDIEYVLASRESRLLSDVSIERLVKKFLSWQLPDSVCSDQCVTIPGKKNRTGTNLLTYIEATQLIEYLLTDVR